MEPEPDQAVKDDANPGKRKRSTTSKSPSKEDEGSPHTNDLTQDVSATKAVQSTPKRQRIDSAATPISSAVPEILDIRGSYRTTLADVPVEILQHIMLFMDPFSLGRLMCVNRQLHDILGSYKKLVEPSGKSNLPLLSAEGIWLSSRRTYLPGMPHPLRFVNELDMFKLTYGKRCQHCGKLPRPMSGRTQTTPWNSGPGPRGVRIIWPYKTRTCADCLRPLLIKETEPALPGQPEGQRGLLPAIFTPSLHYVMSISLRQTAMPPGLHLTKYHYRPDFERAMREASDAYALGQAAYALWCQHNDVLRQEAFTDVVRLEAWELAQKVANELTTFPSNMTSRSSDGGSSAHSETLSRSYITASSGGYRPFTATSSLSGASTSRLSNSFVPFTTAVQQFRPTMDMIEGRQPVLTSYQPMNPPPPDNSLIRFAQSRPDQKSHDLVRLKGEKRADIQRRCLELNPPIPPHILDRLPAFQSALQGLLPIDEARWESLQVELQSQRRATEIPQVADFTVGSKSDAIETSTVYRAVTPVAELIEIDYRKEALRPAKDKLRDFAREYVHSHYAGGTGLTYSSAPQFAAQVLLYARERFYQNQRLEDAAFEAHGEKPPDEGPSGIRARTLKLEHMRHIFESSVKPYTEFVRKELFLCSACDTQGRHFQFEAIIQHYASKHTDNFSRDKAVVSWKAEWPAQPPFEAQPGRESDHASSISNLPSTSQLVSQTQVDSWRGNARVLQTAHNPLTHHKEVTSGAPHQHSRPSTTAHHDSLYTNEVYYLRGPPSYEQRHVDVPMTEADTGQEIRYDYSQARPPAALQYDHHYQRSGHDGGVELEPESRWLGADDRSFHQRRSFIQYERFGDSSGRQSRDSPLYHQSNLGGRHGRHADGGFSPLPNVADRFLDTVDLEAVRADNARVFRSASAGQLFRQQPINDLERNEDMANRRLNRNEDTVNRWSNTIMSDINDIRPSSNMIQTIPTNRHVEAQLDIDASRYSYQDRYEYRHRRDSLHDGEGHHVMPLAIHEQRDEEDLPYVARRPPRQPYYYVDRYGREAQPISSDARYAHPHREVILERPVHHDAYYEQQPYERRDIVPNPEHARYYIDRSGREHVYEADRQYVRYEPLSEREPAYEDRAYYSQQGSSRPPPDGSYYERL